MQRLKEFMITEEPFYLAQGDELAIAKAAYVHTIPLLLKGPTGCGKTRFMKYLAWKLQRPLVTVSCHDDLSTSDILDTLEAALRERGLLKGARPGPTELALLLVDTFVQYPAVKN